MEPVQVIEILVGCSFIIIGLLVTRFPDLIGGYNTMLKKEKDSFDIKGFSSVVRAVSMVSGCLLIIGTQICHLLGSEQGAPIVIVVVSLSMCVILVLSCKKHKGKL